MSQTDYDFAVPTAEIGARMEKRYRGFYEFALASGWLGVQRTSYFQYHAGFFTSGSITQSGPAGEYREITTGDYRNLIQHVVQLVTSKRPAWQVKGRNSDYKSQVQSYLAPGLLDYYATEGDLLESALRAAEFCVYQGEGWLKAEWDVYGGDDYTTKKAPANDFDGTPMGDIDVPIKTGDLCFHAYQPLDMVRDWQRRDVARPQWLMPRDWVNKWDLADQYPQFRDEILSRQPITDFTWDVDDWTIFKRTDGDLLPVFTLYHERTSALPRGRKTVLLAPDLVLEDGPLIYDRIPIGRMCPTFIDRTSLGYALSWDLLPLQRAKDWAKSIALTNLITFGVQNVVIRDGTNISASELGEGLNLIKVPVGAEPPAVLQLLSNQAESAKFAQEMTQQMEIDSGIGSVTRGQPDPSLKSGNALALVQAQSLEFISRHQEAWYSMLEYVGNRAIDVIRKRLPDKKAVAIVGKMPGQYIKTFTADDLEGVQLSMVEMGNPVTKTAAGRTQLAENLLQQGVVKDAKGYLQVLSTGNLEPLLEGTEAENLLIKAEQEQLLQGIIPPVLWTDNHPRHIQAALDLLSTPDARENPTITNAVFSYINQSMQVWQQTPPEKLIALGRQPFVGPPPPPPPPKGAPPPPAPPNMQPGAPGIPPGQGMPTNPVTGQEWNPANGGQ